MRILFISIFIFTIKLVYAQVDSLQNADSSSLISPITYISDSDSICSSLYSKSGLASYYGRQFQGRYTSSGERFDMNKYTAAHKSLPFGTYIIVTNLSNYRSLVVKVNDRMPQWNKREIDLSLAAAKYLDYIADGLAEVQIEIYETK